MTVVWVGTSLDSGRSAPIERETSECEFLTYLAELRARGEGYLEVTLPGHGYPCLALSFRGDHAVIHGWIDETTMALLAGDSSVPPAEPIAVPVMDEDALFTGQFVSTLNHAYEVVQAFVRGGEFDSLGEWWNL